LLSLFSIRKQWWVVVTACFLIGGSSAVEYRTIPPASESQLTPAADVEDIGSSSDWGRSNGDNASSRYSRLKQIDRTNVGRLQVAWTYHSGDGKGNIEANPVIVDGILYAPTPGNAMVAVDAVTGREIWRFKPEGRPAFRGLAYWPGNAAHPARLYFPSGDWLYAVEAATGKPVESFGRSGRVRARSTVAPAIYESVVVLPCWNVVEAFDLLTGKSLWTFDLIPRSGQFGSETWTGGLGYGANTWVGMALDSARGIALYLDRIASSELSWNVPSRRQSLHQLRHRAAGEDGRAPLALSGDSTRHMGPGSSCCSEPGNGDPQRP
jgi:outer membrane protein assembly factor BamB